MIRLSRKLVAAYRVWHTMASMLNTLFYLHSHIDTSSDRSSFQIWVIMLNKPSSWSCLDFHTVPNRMLVSCFPKLGKVKLLIFQIMFRRYIQGRTSWFVIITNVNSSQNVLLHFKSLFSPSNSLNVKCIFVRPTPRSLILKLFQTLKHFSRF